ncbi:endospore germination permease [Clostridium folliculivorans]|uniref:endospore germination permease n=1 Tax=Clostridium folliculivorans TaxID=2886038 RepID=UPI0021C34486|nr:endospore germination permease [Clostridium folliculivorans]
MEGLSSKHLILFIAGSMIVSMKIFSSIFISVGGRDTWLIGIISSIVFIILILYIVNTFTKAKTFNFREIIHGAIGDRFGEVYIWLFAVGLFISAGESAAVEASSIHVNLFIESPIWYIMLFFIVPAVYIASRNFNSILNIVLIATSIVLITVVLIEVLVHRYKHFDYLFPLFKYNSLYDQIRCGLEFLGGFSCVAIIFPLLKNVQKTKSFTFHFFIGVLLSVDLVCFAITGHIASMGSMRAKNILFPAFRQVQRISYGNFIENGQILVLILCVIGLMVKYILAINGIVMLFRNNIKNKLLFVTILSILLYIYSLLIGNNAFKLMDILEMDQYIYLVIFLIFPLILFSIYRAKHFHGNRRKLKLKKNS